MVHLKLLIIHLNPFLKKRPSTTSQFVTRPMSLYLKTSLWNGTPYMFNPWYPFLGHSLSFLWKRKCHFSSPPQKQKNGLYWSLKYSFPCFYFDVCSRQPEIKIGHFTLAQHIFYPLPSSRSHGIFYTIHWCHQVSFLACPHPIYPHCHKPHQQAFLLPKKGLVIPF